MTKLAQVKLEREKRDIKNRYIAGEPISAIAKAKGVCNRDIYYHLGTLTPEDKSLHIKNSWLRKKALPVTKRKMPSIIKEDERPEQQSQTAVISGDLVDFIEG